MGSKIVMGRDLMLYIGEGDNLTAANIVCLLKDCTLTMSASHLETTGPGGPAKTFIYDQTEATLSGDGVVSYEEAWNVVSIQEQLKGRKIINWKFTAFETGGLIYSGKLLWSTVANGSPYNEAANFSFEAQVTGEVSIEKVDIIKTVYLADQNGVLLPGCPNPYPVMVKWYDLTPIGLAYSQADVIGVFNSYSGNTTYTLTGFDPSNGCNFTMTIAWSEPVIPDFIIAEPVSGLIALSDEYTRIIETDTNEGITPV